MIEDSSLRIFHIDTECYVIYLGKAADDYRPFLRIGTSPHLSDKAKSFISAVVITESLTGNQLLEHENLQLPLNGETRYIGDPEEIGRLKRFLDQQDLPLEGYEYEEDEESPTRAGAFVYFYRGGNLHIVYDKKRIFKLHDREQKDGHFIYRAEQVVRQVKENPLRFMPRDLNLPGFVLAGNRPYFFRDGRLGSLALSPDYVVDLGRYGIDPDLVQWLVEDRLSEGLLNRFKRAAVTKRELRVASSQPGELQTAVSFFVGMGLSCVVLPLEANRERVFSGFSLARQAEDLVLTFPADTGFPELLFPQGREMPSLLKGVKSKTFRTAADDFQPVQGVPYRVRNKEDRDPPSLLEDYLFDFLRELKDSGDPEVEDYLEKLEPLCRALLSPLGSSGAKILFKTKARTFSDPAPERCAFFLWNIRELARLFKIRKGVSEGLRKHSARLASLISAGPLPETNETNLPILGDLFQEEGQWQILYRLADVLTPGKVSLGKKSSDGVDRFAVQYKEAFHVQERERLERFLAGLSVPAPRRRKKTTTADKPKTPLELLAETGTSRDSRDPQAEGPGEKESREGEPGRGASPARERVDSSQKKGGGEGKALSRSGLSEPGSFSGEGQGGDSAITDQGKDPRRSSSFPIIALLLLALAGGAAFFLLRSCEKSGSTISDRAEGDPSEKEKLSGTPGEEYSQEGATEPLEESPLEQATESLEEGQDRPLSPAEAERAASPAETVSEEGLPSHGEEAGPAEGFPVLNPDSFALTILDVYHLVNEVAVENGYRPLGQVSDARPDPNWIFPANSFRLPDGDLYRVQWGDTLWGISTDYIRRSMHVQAEEYNRLMLPYYQGDLGAEERAEISTALQSLAETCRSEKMREFFLEMIATLTKA